MDDRIGGPGKKVSGSIKEAIGKVTGDRKMRVEGTTEKAAGTAQNAVRDTKDAVRGFAKEWGTIMAADASNTCLNTADPGRRYDDAFRGGRDRRTPAGT